MGDLANSLGMSDAQSTLGMLGHGVANYASGLAGGLLQIPQVVAGFPGALLNKQELLNQQVLSAEAFGAQDPSRLALSLVNPSYAQRAFGGTQPFSGGTLPPDVMERLSFGGLPGTLSVAGVGPHGEFPGGTSLPTGVPPYVMRPEIAQSLEQQAHARFFNQQAEALKQNPGLFGLFGGMGPNWDPTSYHMVRDPKTGQWNVVPSWDTRNVPEVPAPPPYPDRPALPPPGAPTAPPVSTAPSPAPSNRQVGRLNPPPPDRGLTTSMRVEPFTDPQTGEQVSGGTLSRDGMQVAGDNGKSYMRGTNGQMLPASSPAPSTGRPTTPPQPAAGTTGAPSAAPTAPLPPKAALDAAEKELTNSLNAPQQQNNAPLPTGPGTPGISATPPPSTLQGAPGGAFIPPEGQVGYPPPAFDSAQGLGPGPQGPTAPPGAGLPLAGVQMAGYVRPSEPAQAPAQQPASPSAPPASAGQEPRPDQRRLHPGDVTTPLPIDQKVIGDISAAANRWPWFAADLKRRFKTNDLNTIPKIDLQNDMYARAVGDAYAKQVDLEMTAAKADISQEAKDRALKQQARGTLDWIRNYFEEPLGKRPDGKDKHVLDASTDSIAWATVGDIGARLERIYGLGPVGGMLRLLGPGGPIPGAAGYAQQTGDEAANRLENTFQFAIPILRSFGISGGRINRVELQGMLDRVLPSPDTSTRAANIRKYQNLVYTMSKLAGGESPQKVMDSIGFHPDAPGPSVDVSGDQVDWNPSRELGR